MLLTQKYVIISITYLTLSELPWGEGFSEIAIASASRVKRMAAVIVRDSPPTPFPMTQATQPLTSPISI